MIDREVGISTAPGSQGRINLDAATTHARWARSIEVTRGARREHPIVGDWKSPEPEIRIVARPR